MPPEDLDAPVRGATDADLPAVEHVWRSTGRDVLPREEVRAALLRSPGLLLVADVPGAGVVGTVLGTFDGRRGWIHRLAVLPDHRRAGLAGALVDEVEARLTACGAPRVNLLVLPDDTAALRFWQHRGYLSCPDVLLTRPLAP